MFPPNCLNRKLNGMLHGGRKPLVVILLIVFIGWGILLPQLASRPAFRRQWTRLENAGYDPSAMYYTDHPNAFTQSAEATMRPSAHLVDEEESPDSARLILLVFRTLQMRTGKCEARLSNAARRTN